MRGGKSAQLYSWGTGKAEITWTIQAYMEVQYKHKAFPWEEWHVTAWNELNLDWQTAVSPPAVGLL